MSRVSICRAENYEPQNVLARMRECLAPLGGMQAFVQSGQTVLLKPNIIGSFPAEKGATTHPAVVRAAILLAQEAGARVIVGDSPGIHDPAAAARKCGILDVIKETGAELADFRKSTVFTRPENTVGKKLELAQAVADADVLITLPKLKTHIQMVYTGALKNQFGLVVGKAKARYHYRFKKRDVLNRLFIDINRTAGTALAIMDAITGMEGHGPSGGEPRHIGALLASADPAALDTVACHIVGINPAEVPTLAAAKAEKYGCTDMNCIETVGADWRELYLPDFEKAVPSGNIFVLSMPEWAQDLLRRLWAPRPRIDRDKCIRCMACRDGCPTEPPSINPDYDGAGVNTRTCIRCYCCHEFCPVKAIDLKR